MKKKGEETKLNTYIDTSYILFLLIHIYISVPRALLAVQCETVSYLHPSSHHPTNRPTNSLVGQRLAGVAELPAVGRRRRRRLMLLKLMMKKKKHRKAKVEVPLSAMIFLLLPILGCPLHQARPLHGVDACGP
jgi:hypothetical protein